MGTIKEYNAPKNLGIDTDNRAMESWSMAGRRIAGNYGEAADAMNRVGRHVSSMIAQAGETWVKYEEHKELSQGAVVYTHLQQQLTERWNAMVSDPDRDQNDTHIAGMFNEEVLSPALDQFQSAFRTDKGREWAQTRVERLRHHMFEKTAADTSAMAGSAFTANYTKSVNAISNTVKDDPSGLDNALDSFKSIVDALVESSPNLKGVQAVKIRTELLQKGQEQIVKSAIFGAIEKNPDYGVKLASDDRYKEFISGQEVKQMESYARTQLRAQRQDVEFARHQQERARKEASEARMDEYLQNLHSGNPTLTSKQVSIDPTLRFQDKARMIQMIDREMKPETDARKSATNANDLLRRIRTTDTDRIDSLDTVYAAYAQGEINRADLNFLKREFVEFRTPEGETLGKAQDKFLQAFKSQIDKSILGVMLDPAGGQRYYEFSVEVQRKVQQYKKDGKDPYVLFDPSSPEYMGMREILGKYISPLDLRAREAADRARNVGKQKPRPPISTFDPTGN